jgi:hypothetical protein
LKHLGWWLLKALRRMGAHVHFEPLHVLRNGLAAETAAVRAEVATVVSHSNGGTEGAADGSLGFTAEQQRGRRLGQRAIAIVICKQELEAHASCQPAA